jgi:hypothetical protein
MDIRISHSLSTISRVSFFVKSVIVAMETVELQIMWEEWFCLSCFIRVQSIEVTSVAVKSLAVNNLAVMSLAEVKNIT